MKTERQSLDVLIIEEKDIKELGFTNDERMGQYDIFRMGNMRYVCLPYSSNGKRRKEWKVLFAYDDSINPEKLRGAGVI